MRLFHGSIFDTAGAQAAQVAHLGGLLIGVCVLVYLATLGFFFFAVWRARRRASGDGGADPSLSQPPPSDSRKAVWIATTLMASFGVLTLFVAASFMTDRRLVSASATPTVRIEVTAHQWWWEIRYLDPLPSRGFVTANELHLPLQETAAITLRSADVIHSFWIPSLAPKRDAIPAHDQSLHLTATRAGRWPGRCSEFCGYQHARMGLVAVVEPREQFDAWRSAQASSAKPAGTDLEKRGEQVFASRACVLCHVVRGSAATGYSATAPDLTHVASRARLAAETVPNETSSLRRWVRDPHSLKPGVRMPPNALPDEELDALVAWLGSLR